MSPVTRADFLKTALVGLGGLSITPLHNFLQSTGEPAVQTRFFQQDNPSPGKLGRVIGGRVPVKLRPDIDSQDVAFLNDDDVVPWLREIVGKRPLWYSQRFVETPDGYVYAPNLQPVQDRPNEPIDQLPQEGGVWVEVTVPYVDLVIQNPPARSPWLKNSNQPRLYYSQIMWVDEIKTEEGKTWYRVRELYGSFGDVFYAPAEAFKPLTVNDLSPLSPEVEEKNVVVNVTDQTMSCFEGSHEVFFCQVSTGGKYDAEGNPSEKWATPVGPHSIWRKLVSVHMTGGTTGGGYDLPGIGWTVLFSGDGVAVHSTFWHNSFGIPRSHGCVNARPEDAKWIFRWTLPDVPYHPGDVTFSGRGSTKVIVVER